MIAPRRSVRVSGLVLVLVAQAFDALVHLVHLALELVDLDAAGGAAAGRAGLRCALVLLRRGLSFPPRERREHAERSLEQLHIAADLVLERPERAAAERLRDLLAEF